VILDVREPHEYEICRINGSKLIPLGDLPTRINELDTADDIIVHCHHGMRSLQATRFLRHMGFKRVKNLGGGIDAWAEKHDTSMPRY
jgi:rhodanese-related sulfurtransferase